MVPKTSSLPRSLLLTDYSVFSLQNTKGLPIEIMTYSDSEIAFMTMRKGQYLSFSAIMQLSLFIKYVLDYPFGASKYFGDFKKQQSLVKVS